MDRRLLGNKGEKMKWLLVVCFLIPTVASAEQQQQQSPEVQALIAKLLAELNSGLQCSANSIAGRQELEKAYAEVKRLKDKYEPEAR